MAKRCCLPSRGRELDPCSTHAQKSTNTPTTKHPIYRLGSGLFIAQQWPQSILTTSSDTAAAAVPRPRVEVGRWALPEGADAVPADVTEVAEGTAVVLAAPEGGEGSS